MESAKIIADLTVFFVQTVKRIIEAIGLLGKEYDAASLEGFVREQILALGAVVFEYCWAYLVSVRWGFQEESVGTARRAGGGPRVVSSRPR